MQLDHGQLDQVCSTPLADGVHCLSLSLSTATCSNRCTYVHVHSTTLHAAKPQSVPDSSQFPVGTWRPISSQNEVLSVVRQRCKSSGAAGYSALLVTLLQSGDGSIDGRMHSTDDVISGLAAPKVCWLVSHWWQSLAHSAWRKLSIQR